MKKLMLIFILSYTSIVYANSKTDKAFISNLKSQGLSVENQAYCYSNEKGEIEGMNLDARIRLASVSKLVTSLWSIEKLGIKKTFDTKLYIKNNNLHIEGSFDPFFGNEKMFFLISELNRLGYTSFDKITFDKNLMVFPDAQYEADEYPNMSRTWHVKLLNNYFNTDSWSNDYKNEYQNFKYLAPNGKYLDAVTFKTAAVEFSETNPLLNEEDVKVLTLSSPPLYRYLKEVNVKSNNYVAETLFKYNGNVKAFDQYLFSKFNLTKDTMHLYTGSGLPYYDDNNVRLDNYSTCRSMVRVVKALKEEIEKQGLEIEDVVAVPGNDKGTFRNRIFPSDYKNSFVAKTGTLMHTSTLAGMMNTQDGFSFFGIFNQSTDIQGSKAVQNEMVKAIMTEMGGPKAFDYEVLPFHTYSNDNLKANSSNDFTSIDGGLY